ncbi:MAG: hypothetical protein AAF517_08030 [Planctomycetota bacterium]
MKPLFALFVLFSLPANLYARDAVDQVHIPNGDLGSIVKDAADKAQTFTVGFSGTLARVDLFVEKGSERDDLIFDIRPTDDAGVPMNNDELVLASRVISPEEVAAAVDGVLKIELDDDAFDVEAGDVLAISLRTGTGFFSWIGGGEYDRGGRFFRRPPIGFPEWSDDGAGQDFGFRTYVSVGPHDDTTFLRSDADGSGSVDITDGVFILNFLFLGGSRPSCLDAADANDSGTIDIADAVRIFGFLFLGTPLPPPQGIEFCDADPTEDSLNCERLPPCSL